MLLEKVNDCGSDINLKDKHGLTGLGMYFRSVCDAGDMQNLEKLMEIKDKVNFNEGDQLGQTGFHYACWKGHEPVVKFLL